MPGSVALNTAIHARKASMRDCLETITNRWVCGGGHHDLFMIDRNSQMSRAGFESPAGIRSVQSC